MSSASIPVFVKALSNLRHCLNKGQAFVQEKKIDDTVLTQYRLAPDMLPFTRQILIACDNAKNGVARLAGIEPPKFEDTEVTFDDLKARIAKTLEWLATVPADQLNGTEDKDITFPSGRTTTAIMKGEAYLNHWLVPNVYFHVTMAYAILRHNGVDLGKADYLVGERV